MLVSLASSASRVAAYIDPGTGSMLFTLLVGLLSASYFFVRKLAIRARFAMSGGSAAKGDGTRMPYVIFSDDKRYWNVFKPICDEFERRGIDVFYWTASPDDPALKESYEHVTCEFVGEGNKAFARLNMMSADVCLATTPGLQVYQWKRSKEVLHYAHILHAASTAAWYRMFGLDYFDSVLLSNEYQVGEIRELEQKRDLAKSGLAPKDLPIVGCTYMDSMAERLASASPLEDDGNITVLLAPSWGPIGLLGAYGERMIQALVDTGYRVVVRPHPQSMKSERQMIDDLMSKYPDGEAVEWNFDNDNFDCLRRADVLISDMSGVIHDFALVFDKPVIYSLGGMDTGVYDAAWLDEPFWESPLFTNTGISVDESQFDHMKEVIDNVLADPNVAARRALAREQCWFYQGECAARTVDYLVAKHDELTKS